jgi:hypothetical protein
LVLIPTLSFSSARSLGCSYYLVSVVSKVQFVQEILRASVKGRLKYWHTPQVSCSEVE